jgi:hypothetical protein
MCISVWCNCSWCCVVARSKLLYNGEGGLWARTVEVGCVLEGVGKVIVSN